MFFSNQNAFAVAAKIPYTPPILGSSRDPWLLNVKRDVVTSTIMIVFATNCLIFVCDDVELTDTMFGDWISDRFVIVVSNPKPRTSNSIYSDWRDVEIDLHCFV